MPELHFDYVIVGGGSAGCVLAARLSEDPAVRVCLLEAGPRDRHPLIHVPAGIAWLMRSRRLNWNFQSEAQAGAAGRSLFCPRGRMLGGSSSSNAMCYVRGHASDYDDWAALGNDGWSYAEVLPYFKRAEDQSRGADAWHGSGGPLAVMDFAEPSVLTQAFLQAARQAGYPMTPDFNGARQEGAGLLQVTQRRGRRCSTAVGYLRPARERGNLTVLTGARATRVLLDGPRAEGVEFLRDGMRLKARAAREVLLCAGALQSPQLLMLSGIGPADHLHERGIVPRLDLGGVGRNLQDHPDVMVVHDSIRAVSSGLTPRQMVRGPLSIYDYLRHGRGLLTNNGAEGAAFLRSRPQETRPDIQLHFMPARLRDHGRDLAFMAREGYSMHVCCLRPKSRGSIRLRTADPLAAPAIDLGFLSHEDDLHTLVRGVRRVRSIFAAPAFDAFRGAEVKPGRAQTDEEIADFVRRDVESAYHPVGTCAMGRGALAVVDARLRVHGLQGLRVVDASVMPTLVGGNTNAPTIMVAEKAADLIREDAALVRGSIHVAVAA
ncbi:MAG: choline dehydrogenase [Aquabacterium sp.]|nr:MAG: choline dehydrogenase [Aquabacterium sp.]